MIWKLSHSADATARDIADRHYNRQKPGSLRFVPPGSCVVFLSLDDRATWATSWPFAEYVKHEWAGAWVNSLFRNEGDGCASEMIRQAVAATRWFYGQPPDLGMVTFIDATKVKPTMVRGLPTWGMTYVKAGFHYVGMTKSNFLLAFQLLPKDMPEPEPPINGQLAMFGAVSTRAEHGAEL